MNSGKIAGLCFVGSLSGFVVLLLFCRFVVFDNSQPDRSLLTAGDPVVISPADEVRAAIVAEPDFGSLVLEGRLSPADAARFSGVKAIPGGTHCAVVVDFAGDADDCSDGNRRTMIRVVEGPLSGLSAPVIRGSLRPIDRWAYWRKSIVAAGGAMLFVGFLTVAGGGWVRFEQKQDDWFKNSGSNAYFRNKNQV